jgi:hypothetical protein
MSRNLAPVGSPVLACKHGTQDIVISNGVLRAKGFCPECIKVRQASARNAAASRAANGTASALCWIFRRENAAQLPSWLRWPSKWMAQDYCGAEIVMTRDRIVHDPKRSPVWVVGVNTYRLDRLLTLDELKALLRYNESPKPDAPLLDSEPVTIAPQWAVESGEDLARFGMSGPVALFGGAR